MAKIQHPPDEYEATREELTGVGRNRRFDAVIDDGDDAPIEVICRRGGEVLPISKPSRAFYFGDREQYVQEAQRFDKAERARILNSNEFARNLRRFEDLKQSCQRGFVIPFVGAGMSKSAGCPEWKEYLLNLCGDARLDRDAIRRRLEDGSDYECVMNDIVTRLGQNRFNRDFERDFKTPDEISGAVTLLPRLFDCSVITTNFDLVLETAYENEDKPFKEKVNGRGQIGAFFHAVPAGHRYLLKLHGNLDNAAERVLTKTEYDKAYGDSGVVDLSFPLPKLLCRLFTSYSFLFLGCSLVADRTMQTFKRVADMEGPDNLPDHYALLPCPADSDKHHKVEERLADAHISPIWYPDGEHQHVEEIVRLLTD